MGVRGGVDLAALSARIREIEARRPFASADRPIDEAAQECLATGWEEVDATLGGGLAARGLHEWFGVRALCDATDVDGPGRMLPNRWTPPLFLMTHLARRALGHAAARSWALWIGKPCHPYPRVLVCGSDRQLLERSLFVAAQDAAARLWAVELALRSPAVGVVVADGSRFDRGATQRIQFLAWAQGKLVLTVCPPGQESALSAAQSRWRVCAAGPTGASRFRGVVPRWRVELLRCKGMRPTQGGRDWLLEWNRAEGVVRVSAGLVDPAGAAQESILANGGGLPRGRTG
ncbi:MAG: hypothetical protein IPM64_09580 [Phycisphaerales bacterium]|nr:hypothetical protein [Phycisphaerales bacterium]